MTNIPLVAFLGIGLMGAPMARNLCAAGYQLSIWNRTAEKARALIADGARVTDTAHHAVEEADIIISMLSDGMATQALLFEDGAAAAMKKGALVIDMSSSKASEAKDIARRLAELGVGYLDAPVSGGTKGAEAASLAIMVGGDKAFFDKAMPILQVMGRPTLVGGTGAGQMAKLANQAIVGVSIGIVAEAMLFLEKGGADPAAVREALRGGFADSTILQQHGERMTTGNFTPGGTARTQEKDMANVLYEAEKLGLKLPLTQILHDRYQTLVETLDGGDKDHSALYLELLAQNNQTPK